MIYSPPMSGSGSVCHPSSNFAGIGFSLLVFNEEGGLKINFGASFSASSSDSRVVYSAWVGIDVKSCSQKFASFLGKFFNFFSRPESRQDYPPNLSILISGGKENNCDALSNGE